MKVKVREEKEKGNERLVKIKTLGSLSHVILSTGLNPLHPPLPTSQTTGSCPILSNSVLPRSGHDRNTSDRTYW